MPPEAIWNEKANEWQLGEKKDGQCVGEWRWWLAPIGHLCCRTHFDEVGAIQHYTRYHPNGERSQTGSFGDSGHCTEETHWRSTAPTTEFFPEAPETAYRAERVVGFSPTTYRYYDEGGHELNLHGRRIREIETDFGEYLESGVDETAQETLARYAQFLREAMKDMSPAQQREHQVHFEAGPVDIKDIREAEARLKITLPPSYVEFVTSHGTFRLGNRADAGLLPAAELKTLYDHLSVVHETKKPEQLAEALSTDLESIEALQHSIVFSEGSQQVCCFRLDSTNPETGEVCVGMHPQDEEIPLTETCHGRGFDIHLRELLAEKMRDLADTLHVQVD